MSQGQCAMPEIFEAMAFGATRQKRQNSALAVKRPKRRLVVRAQHRRV